jgi:hypothetical protein
MNKIKNIPKAWVETTLGEITYFVNKYWIDTLTI